MSAPTPPTAPDSKPGAAPPRPRRWPYVLLVLALAVGGLALFVVFNMPSHTEADPERLRELLAEAPKTDDAVLASIRKGVAFLEAHQEKDGHFVKGMLAPKAAFTGMAVSAIVQSPDWTSMPADDAARTLRQKRLRSVVARAVQAIRDSQQPDGGLYSPIPGMSFSNYSTAFCIRALVDYGAPEDEPVIQKAVAFLKKNQYSKDSPMKGGWSYQDAASGDLNNTTTVLEALNASGLDPDDPAFEMAREALSNLQNRSESNQSGKPVTDDGGFTYKPGESPAGYEELSDGRKAAKSYGVMTYAGLVSFLYAHVDRDDPRVQDAWDWIRRNYDLQENVGVASKGLFYYYRMMAKALSKYGEAVVPTTEHGDRVWAKDLSARVIELQTPDGSWVNKEDTSYLEGDRIMVTAYALHTLSICYDELRKQ